MTSNTKQLLLLHGNEKGNGNGNGNGQLQLTDDYRQALRFSFSGDSRTKLKLADGTAHTRQDAYYNLYLKAVPFISGIGFNLQVLSCLLIPTFLSVS